MISVSNRIGLSPGDGGGSGPSPGRRGVGRALWMRQHHDGCAEPLSTRENLRFYGSLYATSAPGKSVWMLPICTTMYWPPFVHVRHHAVLGRSGQRHAGEDLSRELVTGAELERPIGWILCPSLAECLRLHEEIPRPPFGSTIRPRPSPGRRRPRATDGPGCTQGSARWEATTTDRRRSSDRR